MQWGNKDKLPEPALKNVLKEFSSLNLDPRPPARGPRPQNSNLRVVSTISSTER